MVGAMKAKKRLGQNFLIDENIIKTIADEISAFSNDLILEIGPGRGALTKYLVNKNAKYIAFEIDNDLNDYLKKYESTSAKIIYEDFLKADLNKYLKNFSYERLFVVGNLPYYITTPIIEKIINSNLNFESLVIMVQKEVAERFMAKSKTKDYGYFTLYLKYYFDIVEVCDAPKYAFKPIPKVDSMVIKLTERKNKPKLDIVKYQGFLKLCFAQKRKNLKNNLGNENFSKIKNILDSHNLSENVRAEELPEEIFIEIFNYLNNGNF